MSESMRRVRDLSVDELAHGCANGGFYVDYGAAMLRVRSRLGCFVRDFQTVYGAYAASMEHANFADYHVEMVRGRGVRALLKPQSRFTIDGIEPFDPFPLANALPLFEWGVNWCFAQRFNQYLLLHAGVLARDDRAVILAAPPGAGKSTLAAALMVRGFRLLSDEFGVLCPEAGTLLPMLKPVALKNQSVEVIRSFAPDALIGPLFAGTRKGDVAHLAPDEASVDGRHRCGRPSLVLFPAYKAGVSLSCRRLSGEQAFARLAFNSFNYALLGPRAFEAVGDVIETCEAHELHYSRLDEAVEHIGALLADAAGVQCV